MELYDFEIRKGDELIGSARSVEISESRAAWPKVMELAARVNDPGCRILVTNASHEIVIRIGVNAAREMGAQVGQAA